MPLLSHFDTPAGLRDLDSASNFYEDWSTYVSNQIPQSTPGSGDGEFYNATQTDVTVAGERRLVWMAFPREVLVRHRDDREAALAEAENRHVQNEYCEWRVERNDDDQIVRVVFVTETPEYWRELWNADRGRVVDLYNHLLKTDQVQESDLTDDGVHYQPENRWNTDDGIVHMIQDINKLDLAIGLAEGAAVSDPAQDNFQMDPFADTSVDPRVVFDVGTLVRKSLSVTLRDPIGLYIAGWDDTGWTQPDGTPVGDYWTIERGRPGEVLRLSYEVPAEEGFTVSDIQIGGRPIRWGGQLAEHVTVMIAGTAGTRTSGAQPAARVATRETDERTKPHKPVSRQQLLQRLRS